MTIKVSEESYSANLDRKERKLTTFSTAFGILRQQLVRNIGFDRIKDFLFHYGWEMGVNDANNIMEKEDSVKSLVEYGPLLHIENGHITGMSHECDIVYDDNQNLESVFGRGTWVHSYEAEEHVRLLGRSHAPVCHTLIGYASGYMSTVFGEPLYAKEYDCVGKGDEVCTWVVKTQRQWESEQEGNAKFYNDVPIVKELEVTYEQLLEQQKFVTRLADFQKQLTEEVSNGSDLKKITDMVYSMGGIPIIVTDTAHQTLAHSGLSDEQYALLKEDMDQYLQKIVETNDFFKTKENQILPFKRKTIKTDLQERLLTPIIVQKEVIGFCAFIYEDMKQHNDEEDYLFLDRFSNAVSLLMLNEKTRFESFERMKGNFLDQILDRKLPAGDIIKRGRYTGVDLTKAYYISVVEFKNFAATIEEEFLLHEQILETTFRYFNEKKHNLLIGQRDGKMIIFISEESLNHSKINDVISDYQQFIAKKYPQGEFKLGISSLGEGIDNAATYYEEALIALRLTFNKSIVPFQSLGIIGILINSNNMNGIKMVAKQELGSLYNVKEQKMLELLKTLYIFLLNGGKLEKTMNDLALSMSGLRHRIQRIESILEKDLRDPSEAHQLLLIIKALIALGEVNMDMV